MSNLSDTNGVQFPRVAPIALTGAIALAFAALTIECVRTDQLGQFIFAIPLTVFGLFFLLFVGWRKRIRSVLALRFIWGGLLLVSVAAWVVSIGSCVVPQTYISGPQPISVQQPTLLERPWLAHRVYLSMLRGITNGGIDAVLNASVIVLCISLPTLAVYAFIQLRRTCLKRLAQDLS